MKEYKETKRGFLIVPKADFDLKHIKGDIARSTCPACRDERGHPGDTSVKLNLKTGIGKCFHCGSKFILKEKFRTYNDRSRPVHKHDYKLPKCDDLKILHSPDIIAYLKSRKLDDEDLMMRMHVMEGVRNFKGLDFACMAFPAYDGKVAVNCMYRTVDKRLLQDSDCELIPWNIDAALGQTELFITEGRMDALSIAHCGYENVISVANGSNFEVCNFDRFKYSHLDNLKTIYIAGDMDTPGQKLRKNLALYFGESRCKIVEWSWPVGKEMDEVNDANECLIEGGKEAVKYCIDNAVDCPLSGVVTLTDVEDGMDDIRDNGLPDGKAIGLYELDNNMRFLEGQFIVLTGSPGTGKSTFADFIAVRLLVRFGWKCAVFSPEKRPIQEHYTEYASKLLGYNVHDKVNVHDGAYDRCKRYMDSNIFHIGGDIKKDMPTILHTAEQLIIKEDIKLLLIDPFAYIDLSHESGVTDYEKINENIRMLAEFATDKCICVILVAHPRKPVLLSSGKMAMPTLYDISGSSMFYNLCDTGIIMHKDDSINRIVVYVDKIRSQPRMGTVGHAAICFDPESGRYNICHADTSDAKMVRYIDYTINHKNWVPRTDAEQGTFNFEDDDDIPPVKGDGCPF